MYAQDLEFASGRENPEPETDRTVYGVTIQWKARSMTGIGRTLRSIAAMVSELDQVLPSLMRQARSVAGIGRTRRSTAAMVSEMDLVLPSPMKLGLPEDSPIQPSKQHR